MADLAIPLLAQQGGGAGDWWVPLLLVGVIFYFVVIRPGSRERRQREDQLKALQKHDKVITNAGIHGTVVALDDDTVTLRVDEKNNVRIRFTRSAVWQVLKGDEEPKDATGARTP